MISISPESPKRQDYALALLTAFASFVVYLVTLAPSIGPEDGGELAAAAYSLGIPHPTGYPLWTMLGWVFTKLIPFGEIAWRVNLMSAFWASGTVGLVVLTLRQVSVSKLAAAVAGFVLACSREFWEQSVIAEVYTLNAFGMVLCVYLLLEWTRTASRWTIYLFALIYGASLSNHSTMFLLGPMFLVYILAVHPPIRREPRTLFTALGVFLAGAVAVHLYLPIRSMADPAMDWGNPETLAGFWEVFTRAQYSSIMQGERSFGLFARQLGVFGGFYFWEFTPWVLPLVVPGVVLLHRGASALNALLVSMFTVILLASILVPNFPIEHQTIWLNSTYWIPLTVIGAIWIGAGIHWLLERVQARPYIRLEACVILLASPLFAHWDHNDMSGYTLPRDYGLNLLNTMEPDAIYVGSGDHTIFPVIYLQIVEEYRTDVTLANKYGYILEELYADMPDVESVKTLPARKKNTRIINWLLETTGRPVYTVHRWSGIAASVEPRGLLYRYARTPLPSDAPDNDALWSSYRWPELDTLALAGQWTSENIGYEYRIARARHALEQGDTESARTLLTEAGTLLHNDKRALLNIGMTYARAERYDSAAATLRLALKQDSAYVPALYNLARCLQRLGQTDEALEHAETLLEIDPDSAAFEELYGELSVEVE